MTDQQKQYYAAWCALIILQGAQLVLSHAEVAATALDRAAGLTDEERLECHLEVRRFCRHNGLPVPDAVLEPVTYMLAVDADAWQSVYRAGG